MLEAYFDESGTHGEESGAVTVAGFVATRERWTEFGGEWADFLAREGIKTFHRTHLESFYKEFARDKGWDEERRNRVVNESQAIIGKYVQVGFAHTVFKADYDEVVKGDVRLKLGAKHYTFCGQACMRRIAAWAALSGHNEAINYFFEGGAKGTGELSAMMARIAKKPEARAAFRLSSISFAKKYDEVIDEVMFPGLIQLQAADILAYEVYKHMENFHFSPDKRPMRQSFLQLLNLRFPLETRYHDKGQLEELVERVESGDLAHVY